MKTQIMGDRHYIDVDGHLRSFLQAGPLRPDKTVDHVLFAIHGSNQSSASFRRFLLYRADEWAARNNAIVIYPDSWRRGLWNDARISTPSRARAEGVDDVAFLSAIAGSLEGEYGQRPLFAFGYSNGGQLVIRALREASGVFSAALLAGALVPTEENLIASPRPSRSVPLFMIHGTADRIVPYAGGQTSLFGFRPRGSVRSFQASLQFWADAAAVGTLSTYSDVLFGEDPSRAVVETALRSENGDLVVDAFSMKGAGHVVPLPGRKDSVFLGRSPKAFDPIGYFVEQMRSTHPAP